MAKRARDYIRPSPGPSWLVAKDRETGELNYWGPYQPNFKGGGLGIRKGSREWYECGHWWNEAAWQAERDIQKSPCYIEAKLIKAKTAEDALSEYGKA